MNLYSIIAVIVSAGWCSSAVAATKEPRLGHLTPTEISFLMKHAPEINQVVSSGAVVVYGSVIEPPILVTIDRDRIEVGGLQVMPRQEMPSRFGLRKRLDRIHELYFVEKKSGQASEEGARRRAEGMKTNGEISSFEFRNKNFGLDLTLALGGEEWGHGMDSLCPTPLSVKYHFILRTLFRAYNLKKAALGKPEALGWLHARFADLKDMGILATYQFADEDETVNARFSCDLFGGGFGFYGASSPRALAYEKSWKAKEPETIRAFDDIVQGLSSGQVRIYTFGFDRKLPPNTGAIKLFRDIASGNQDKEKSRSLLKDVVGLTQEQADKLLEELR